MDMNELPDQPQDIGTAARYLRVSRKWLQNEVESGRLPGLQTDRTALLHLPTVATILAERAKVERKAVQDAR